MNEKLLLLIVCSALACCDQTPPAAKTRSPVTLAGSAAIGALSGSLEQGPHAVGFRKERLPLPSAPSGEPSSTDLYFWYPATNEAAPSMTLADYYRVQQDDEHSEPDGAKLRDRLLEDMTSPPGIDASTLDAVLAAPMWASADAALADGAHPLVLWSYRDSVPTMQTLLNEYLASHGYVVAFAWPRDHATPFPWQQGLSVDEKSRALEAQVRMLERVLDALSTRDWIEANATSILAWSYGGESAGRLQRRRSEVTLAIGVDATLVSGWVYESAEALEALDRRELSVPYALLRNGRPFIGAASSTRPPLLAEIEESWFVRFPELSHGNFNFPGGMIPGVLNLTEVSRWAVGGEHARAGYEAICRHVLGLADRHVRHDTRDPAQWSAELPEGFVEIERHRRQE